MHKNLICMVVGKRAQSFSLGLHNCQTYDDNITLRMGPFSIHHMHVHLHDHKLLSRRRQAKMKQRVLAIKAINKG